MTITRIISTLLDHHCVKSVRIRSRVEYLNTYSVQMREKVDQNNSKYGLFSRSACSRYFHDLRRDFGKMSQYFFWKLYKKFGVIYFVSSLVSRGGRHFYLAFQNRSQKSFDKAVK